VFRPPSGGGSALGASGRPQGRPVPFRGARDSRRPRQSKPTERALAARSAAPLDALPVRRPRGLDVFAAWTCSRLRRVRGLDGMCSRTRLARTRSKLFSAKGRRVRSAAAGDRPAQLLSPRGQATANRSSRDQPGSAPPAGPVRSKGADVKPLGSSRPRGGRDPSRSPLHRRAESEGRSAGDNGCRTTRRVAGTRGARRRTPPGSRPGLRDTSDIRECGEEIGAHGTHGLEGSPPHH
jgi:hypothetical protein